MDEIKRCDNCTDEKFPYCQARFLLAAFDLAKGRHYTPEKIAEQLDAGLDAIGCKLSTSEREGRLIGAFGVEKAIRSSDRLPFRLRPDTPPHAAESA